MQADKRCIECPLWAQRGRCCCALRGNAAHVPPWGLAMQQVHEAQAESQRAGPCNWKLINATLKGEKIVKYRALLPLGPEQGHYRIGDFSSKEVRKPEVLV